MRIFPKACDEISEIVAFRSGKMVFFKCQLSVASSQSMSDGHDLIAEN